MANESIAIQLSILLNGIFFHRKGEKMNDNF